MASLPLDVHEVLEQEYEAIHGPLSDKPPARYTKDDILDAAWATRCLTACKIEGETLAALNDLVETGAKIANLEHSPAITDCGRDMLALYVKGDTDKTAEVRRRIVDDAMSGAVRRFRDVRLAALYKTLHDKKDEDARTALCISGGGIRSATFALGVIQGLAGTGVLEKFDYLSTVSGGGYIGSWLSSWSRRHEDGIKGVQDELVKADTGRNGGGSGKRPEAKFDPEPQPLRHLRSYSNYLSPKLGLASADGWTLAALYIRNLLLNLLVIVPVLGAALAAPRLYEYLLRVHSGDTTNALGIVTAIGLAIGFGYLGAARPVKHGRESWAWKINTNTWFVGACVLPLTVAGFCISVFWAKNATAILNETDANLLAETKLWALICALTMTLVPCVFYYYRFFRASYAERRQSAARSAGRQTLYKVLIELLAAVVGLASAAVLFYLLAKKLFPTPLMKVPDPNAVEAWRRILVPLPAEQLYVCFAVPLVLLVFFIQASIFVGVSSRWNEDNDREWWGRAGAWLLMIAVGLGAASFIAVFGPVLLYRAPVILGSLGGASGIAAALIGRSAKTPAGDKEKSNGSAMTNAMLGLTVPIFAVALLAVISLGTTELILAVKERAKDAAKFEREKIDAQFTSTVTAVGAGTDYEQKNEAKFPAASVAIARGVRHLKFVHGTKPDELAAIFLAALGAVILSLTIGANRFSMQGLYRNRLIRAYLGASRYNRDPDRFTGFDENDNLQMYELRPQLLWTSSFNDPCKFIEQIAKNRGAGVEKTIWDGIDGKVQNQIDEAVKAKAITPNLVAGVLPTLNVQMQTVPLEKGNDGGSPVMLLQNNRKTLEKTFDKSLKKLDGRRTPFHVVNTALNLVGGSNLAWQQRMAESFTATPLHCGSLYLGYRDARLYGGKDGISLGTAVAISGAAASPNQGYHSSLPLAFIMTLLNVRLGAWLGNPGIHGRHSFHSSSPRGNLETLLWEMTGSTNDTCPWIYLSDGGHFENLALYEMVLRRCRYIVVSDGGCDPAMNFEDLGNAIRKIRIDLGVPIEIRSSEMFPRPKPGQPLQSGSYVATADIRYSAIDGNDPKKDGLLIYIKPSVYKDEYLPRDVYNYMQQSPEFPHESTSDQFFSESQFESYRALGRHVVDVICGKAAKYANVADFATTLNKPGAVVQPSEQDALVEIAAAIRGIGPMLLPKSP